VHSGKSEFILGGEYVVRGFRYLPCQDGKIDEMVRRYGFYVSEDGIDWGKAVTIGTFSRDIAEQEASFPGKVGRFVRFVAHAEVDHKLWTSMAEMKVCGM
jgi:F5/8 type C domain